MSVGNDKKKNREWKCEKHVQLEKKIRTEKRQKGGANNKAQTSPTSKPCLRGFCWTTKILVVKC